MGKSEEKPAAETEQMKLTATDPVCGMKVDPATARGVAQYKGETFCFCSPGCMSRFLADPAKFLAADYKPVMPGASGAPVQITPARAVQKDPVCGMAVDTLKAAASVSHEGKVYHFCSKGCAEKFKAEPAKYLAPAFKPGGVPAMVQLGSGTAAKLDECRSGKGCCNG